MEKKTFLDYKLNAEVLAHLFSDIIISQLICIDLAWSITTGNYYDIHRLLRISHSKVTLQFAVVVEKLANKLAIARYLAKVS